MVIDSTDSPGLFQRSFSVSVTVRCVESSLSSLRSVGTSSLLAKVFLAFVKEYFNPSKSKYLLIPYF